MPVAPLGSAALALLLSCAAQQEGPAQAPAEIGFDHAHKAWTEVLGRHVRGDRFDYRALVENRGTLDRYLQSLHAVTPDELARWTREQQFAFWINAYNAHVVDLVARNYPLESIKDVGGLFSSVWKKEFIAMPAFDPDGDEEPLSLDEIEHQILRPKFKDARVHAAVNCASLGCPPLRGEAYVADELEEQLDHQVRNWLADRSRNRFDREKSLAQVSAIFDWFEEDFERDAGSVREWIQRYAPPAEAEWMRAAKKLRIEHLDYSWALNDVERAKKN